MGESKIKTEVRGPVDIISLNDPATMNAAGGDLVVELSRAFKRFAAPGGDVRCIVLTGEGRGFCSGANLSGGSGNVGSSDDPAGPDAGAGLETIYNPLVSLLREYPFPIVTAINGAAAGVGCSLALMGDIIVAAESAYFLQAFRRIGLVPDGGSTYLLPRFIGKARAMEMMLMGDKIPAKTALEWGLVNKVVPDADLLTAALEVANTLANGPRSVGQIRQLVWDSMDSEWTGQLHNERIAQRSAGRSEDFKEGVTAFLEKRPAKFNWR